MCVPYNMTVTRTHVQERQFIFLKLGMLHYLCNTTCYLHYTLYMLYTYVLLFCLVALSTLHFLHLYTYVLMSYLSLCCNWLKSIDSINLLYAFLYLVISSCLLSCKFIGLFIRRLSISLCFMQLKRRWSIVSSSLPQMQVAREAMYVRV
jgi:hypothetical protein